MHSLPKSYTIIEKTERDSIEGESVATMLRNQVLGEELLKQGKGGYFERVSISRRGEGTKNIEPRKENPATSGGSSLLWGTKTYGEKRGKNNQRKRDRKKGLGKTEELFCDKDRPDEKGSEQKDRVMGRPKENL